MTFIFLALSRKIKKEKFIAYASYYVVFKSLFNSIWIMCLACLLASKYEISDLVLPILFSVMYYPYTIIETYLVVRKMNLYRRVSQSIFDFLRTWNVGIVVNMFAIWLVILMNQNMGKAQFMIAMYIFIVIFPWIQMYISGLGEHGLRTEKYKQMLEDKYNIKCNVKMYIFNGKTNKNANIYVKGILGKKRIMISDYLVESLTEDEICAILCHEISHCEYYDTEINVIIVNVVSLILIILGYIFELINMPIISGTVITIIMIICLILTIMALRRGQEYKADRYVVDLTKQYSVFADALVKICDLNSTMKKRGAILELFETHPQTEKRIQHIKKYYEKIRENVTYIKIL